MPATQDDTLLIFRIDCIPCAVIAGSVQSIVMPPEHLTQPPGSNRGQPGIFKYAGHIYAVVDLRQRFGIDTPRQGTGRLLLHEKESHRHALWVDEVVGLARSEEGQWATLPPYLPRSLFYSGFLYQQEIILCSTLEALLAMHDAEPIRRHLERLRCAEQDKPSPTLDKPAVPPPVEPSRSAVAVTKAEPGGSTSSTDQQASKNIADNTKARPALRPTPAPRPTIVARPSSPKVPAVKDGDTRPSLRAPLTPRPTATTRPSARNTESDSPADRPRPTVLPLPATGESRWLLWVVLALLLAGGTTISLYPLIKKPVKTELTPPRSIPPATYAMPDTPPPQIVTPVMPPPAALPNAVVEAATTIEKHSTAAVHIESDNEGTITLIIQRDRLQNNGREPSPAANTAEGSARLPIVEQESPGNEGEPTDLVDTSVSPADADWPEPEALPEPCDCTHIVVKGDTLWAIAEQYTNSAFNYPELARQSGIHNPHRIYPGNKVRIIVR
jgi:chemotaxis signal transduction protein/nucleoid-associated protein YgaU